LFSVDSSAAGSSLGAGVSSAFGAVSSATGAVVSSVAGAALSSATGAVSSVVSAAGSSAGGGVFLAAIFSALAWLILASRSILSFRLVSFAVAREVTLPSILLDFPLIHSSNLASACSSVK